jgi:CRP-like cAMP-binding protein
MRAATLGLDRGPDRSRRVRDWPALFAEPTAHDRRPTGSRRSSSGLAIDVRDLPDTQGEAGDSAYFVLDGRVVSGTPAEDGSYRSLATLREGDFFGEIAALTGSRRTANVVADEPTTVLEVPAARLRGVMDVPALSSLFLSALTERLTRTQTADRPRLSGNDQEALRDLRTPKQSAEAVPRTY